MSTTRIAAKRRETYQAPPAGALTGALDALAADMRVMASTDYPHVEVVEFKRNGDDNEPQPEWHGHLLRVVDGIATINSEGQNYQVDTARALVHTLAPRVRVR